MKSKSTSIQLSVARKPTTETIARWKSDKLPNCKGTTELQGGKSDTRMKPDWLKDSSMAHQEAVAESSYLRHIMVLCLKKWGAIARTDHDVAAISGEKNVSPIRQSDMPIVIMQAKWGLPKPRSRKAMNLGSENSAWQRSFRSSWSKVTPCTWRREAVNNSVFNNERV